MKRYQLVILFIANFFIDYSILSRYQIFGVIPSITIPTIIILSMESRNESIVYYGILQGFVQDLAFTNTLGISALLYYLISYYMFTLNKNNYNLLYGYLSIGLSLLFAKIYRLIMGSLISRTTFEFNILNFLRGYFVEFILMIIVFTILHLIVDRIKKINRRNSL